MSEENVAGMSEEQLREYVQQLRAAPAEQVLSGVLSELLEVARIKLGRRDARLFIDSCATLFTHAKAYLSTDLAGQVERALDELRFAQVQAENSSQHTDEPNDLTQNPPTAPATPTAQTQRPASKLWLPGQD